MIINNCDKIEEVKRLMEEYRREKIILSTQEKLVRIEKIKRKTNEIIKETGIDSNLDFYHLLLAN